jgi:hypothetical protein
MFSNSPFFEISGMRAVGKGKELKDSKVRITLGRICEWHIFLLLATWVYSTHHECGMRAVGKGKELKDSKVRSTRAIYSFYYMT